MEKISKENMTLIVEDLVQGLIGSQNLCLPSKAVTELAVVSYGIHIGEINPLTFQKFFWREIKAALLQYEGGVVTCEGVTKYMKFNVSKEYAEKRVFGDYMKKDEETPVVEETSPIEINNDLIDLYKNFKAEAKKCHKEDIILDKSMFLSTIKVSDPSDIEEYLKTYIDLGLSKVLKYKKENVVLISKFRYVLRALGTLVDSYEKAKKEQQAKTTTNANMESKPEESVTTPVVEEPVMVQKFKKESLEKAYILLKNFENSPKVDNSIIINSLTYFNSELSWRYSTDKGILNQLREEVFDLLENITGHKYALAYKGDSRFICEIINDITMNLGRSEIKDLIFQISLEMEDTTKELIDDYFNVAINTKPSTEVPISEPTENDTIIPVKEEKIVEVQQTHRGRQKGYKTLKSLATAALAAKEETEELEFKSTVKGREDRDSKIQVLVELFEYMKNSDGSWKEEIPESYIAKIQELEICKFLDHGNYFNFNIDCNSRKFTKNIKICQILFQNQVYVFMKSDKDFLKKHPEMNKAEQPISEMKEEEVILPIPETKKEVVEEVNKKVSYETCFKEYLHTVIPMAEFLEFNKIKNQDGSITRLIKYNNVLVMSMEELMISSISSKLEELGLDYKNIKIINVETNTDKTKVAVSYASSIEIDAETCLQLLEDNCF